MTKTEMAQVIVQALRGYPELPSKDCARVRNMAKRSKANLSTIYPKALAVLTQNKGEKK